MEMIMRIKLLIPLFFLIAAVINAQEEKLALTLSLEDAQEYALQHNKLIKASRLDVEVSNMARWEAISGGLPKVEGSASLNDNLKIMTTLLPGEIIGQPGIYVPVQFGQQFNASYGVQVSQLLFNASYFVGLQTSKLAQDLSALGLEKSELDTREGVAQTYHLILVTEESLEVLAKNIDNLLEVLKSTEAMYEVGMAESTDVDQMRSNISMLENSMKSMERNIEVSYNLLRFQLGLDPEAEIKLTQSLDEFLEEIDVNLLTMQNLSLGSNMDYRLIEGQERMNELGVKMQKSAVLPTLAGFYSYAESGMGNKLNDLQWFPNSMIGLQLSVPIFASGERYSKIKKAELELDKIRTNKSLVTDQLLMQEKQLKFNLINAREQFESRKENIEVAGRVFTSVENKYKQGMASSLDLTQAHNNYLQAESDYISSLMSLLQNKLALDKLFNQL
jgi:outer membrane protein TolC